MTDTTPKPPAHINAKSKAYFKQFVSEYDCEDSHLEVLVRVCESMTRADEAAAGLKKHGSLMSKDRFGVDRAHPLVAVERAARSAIIDGIRALGVLKRDTKNDRYEGKVF
jgi:phage terminase small subunit